MSGPLARAAAFCSHALERVKDFDSSILWFLMVASVASIVLRLLDEFIFGMSEGDGDSTLTEWCAFGAFVAGLMFVTRRKVKKPTSGKNKKNMDTFADSRGDAQRRSRKVGLSGSGTRRLVQLDNLSPAEEQAPTQVGYFELADVEAIVKACRSGEMPQAEGKLRELLQRGPHLARSEAEPKGVQATAGVHMLVEACLDTGDVDRACNWMQEALGSGIRAAGRTIHAVMDAFVSKAVTGRGSENRRQRAEQALSAAISKGAQPDANCYHCLFDRCLAAGDSNKVEDWLERAANRGRHDSTQAFVGLIRSRNQAPTHQQAEVWLQRATQAGATHLTHLYNAVIQVCVRTNNLERATYWLEKMEESANGKGVLPGETAQTRCSPDIVSYSLIMDACAQRGNMHHVERWFRQMLNSGVCTEAICYSNVIKAHSRAGDTTGATKWLDESVRRGVKPDPSAFNALIAAAARAGNPRMAARILQQMLTDGVEPDTVSFNSVINAYAKSEEGDAHGPERMVELMCQHSIEPDVVTLGAAVHACARVGDKERAETIFKRIVARGKTTPDAICYNALINASVKAHDIAAAERWLDSMLVDGVSPSVVSYTTVLHAHARSGNIEAAERGMEMMHKNGIAANVVSYSALIHACVKIGDVERAEKWFSQMRQAGIQANAVSYSALLDVCAKAGDWTRAERWLGAMQEDNVAPNVVCFNNVIDACTKGSNARRAEAWLRRLLGEEPKMNVGQDPPIEVPSEVVATRQSFTTAAQAYASFGGYGDVERIFSDMQKFGMDLDEFSLTVLLSAYSRARPRQRERAETVFKEYVASGGKITPPPLRVLRACLGAPRCERLLDQLGMKLPACQ